jgi:hypothetical protein
MPESLRNLYDQLTSAPALAVAVFMLGIYCFLTASGITTGFQFGELRLPAPKTIRWKILLAVFGVILLTFAVIYSVSLFPEYVPTVDEKIIYQGKDAKQVISDGEDVYILKYNGNIFRIAQNGLQLIDEGAGTQQIAPAGGVIYILKDNGNIWEGHWPSENPGPYKFTLKDPGTNTKQIVSVGETLYVLKSNGEVWKYFTRPDESGSVRDEFDIIYTGTDTEEISCSGALLYIRKKDGSIWQYAPVQRKEGPWEEIYKGRDAMSIKADGKTLYFIKQDGSAWKYGEDKFMHINTGTRDAKKIDAQFGLVYILTTEQTIWKYNSQNNTSREIDKANKDNETIAAYGPDIFVIKNNDKGGGIRRYNEGLMKR